MSVKADGPGVYHTSRLGQSLGKVNGEKPALSKHLARRTGDSAIHDHPRYEPPQDRVRPPQGPQFVIRSGSRRIMRSPLLDFAPPMTSFVGFEAPVAQLDRVYDFGS